MQLPRPAPTRFLLSFGAALLLTGCGSEEPGAGLDGATGDLVTASRERYEASEEYRDASAEATAAATDLEAELAEAEPSMEAGIEENLDEATAGLDEARAALGRQADDLFEEIQAAITDRRYPQANAALDTLKGMPDANPDAAPDLDERISAIEASLADAQRVDESLSSARAAIDAAKATAAEAPGPDAGGGGGEIGTGPGEEPPGLEK